MHLLSCPFEVQCMTVLGVLNSLYPLGTTLLLRKWRSWHTVGVAMMVYVYGSVSPLAYLNKKASIR